jgi:tyrosyl-tRNA synthetase
LTDNQRCEALHELKQGLEDGTIHPRDAKLKLAKEYVCMYHGEQAAESAHNHFVALFQKRTLPDDIKVVLFCASELEDGRACID